MAEGFAKNFGKNLIEVYSAGSKPSGMINPKAIEVMRELGIDISSQKSKGFKDLPVKDFDCVVTLGCGDQCPFMPAKQHLYWDIEDPKNKSIEIFRKVRDNIQYSIQKLIREST